MNLRLVIADDHPIFRAGLRQIIGAERDLDVVAEEADGAAALDAILRAHPDIIVLDIDMPKKSGLEVVKALRQADALPPAIFLTMYDDEELFDEALNLGVMGYVLKESAVRDIVEAIRTVASGKPYISGLMSKALLSRTRREVPSPGRTALEQLTDAEKRVLRMIAQGMTSRAIADELHVSPKTIDNHRTNIASKLDIRGTHALLKFALRHQQDL
jgi:two-component system, NarL family, response regulator DegU